MDAAAEHARRGHFILCEPYNLDEFGAHMLGWLVKAGRMDEAAEHAWRGLWYAPWNGMGAEAYQLALKMRDQDATRPHWDWILAAAQLRMGLLNPYPSGNCLLEHLNQPPPLPPDTYLERARQIAPDLPVPELIKGVHLAEQQHWQAALPLLERGVLACPEYADIPTTCHLWCARFKCLPEDEALNRPFPESHGALWCYNIGRNLCAAAEIICQTCEDELSERSLEQRRALRRRYREIARTRFEAYFASGEGAFTDASIDSYSHLCEVLGNQYQNEERFDDAIALYQAGIACHPSGELYSGLMECLLDKGDSDAALALAEDYWHEIRQHGWHDEERGYSLTQIGNNIALILHKAQRTLEINIWLDRLSEWWDQCQELDEDERPTRAAHLEILTSLLQLYSIEHPGKAEPILRAHLPEILTLDLEDADAADIGTILRNAGNAMASCNGFGSHPTRERLELAIDLYHRALAITPRHATGLIADINEVLEKETAGLEHYYAEPQPKRKFWQFWK